MVKRFREAQPNKGAMSDLLKHSHPFRPPHMQGQAPGSTTTRVRQSGAHIDPPQHREDADWAQLGGRLGHGRFVRLGDVGLSHANRSKSLHARKALEPGADWWHANYRGQLPCDAASRRSEEGEQHPEAILSGGQAAQLGEMLNRHLAP